VDVNRLLDPRREREATRPLDDVTASDDGSSGGGLRKALLGLGLAGLAYLAVRRAGRSERAPSMSEGGETVDDVRSGDGFEIPIGETGEGQSEGGEPSRGTGTTKGAIGTEPMPGEDLSSGRPAGESASESEDADRDRSDQSAVEIGETDEDAAEEADSDRDVAAGDDSDPEL